jgi:hypothetical protein
MIRARGRSRRATTTSALDLSREKEESFFVHYANKWRLEKKDPSAAVSEPKQPIVYYIDSTVPDEYVPYMMKGVERWQKAFEAAGFKNAIIAKRAPTKEEDPNYDPTDARYNTIPGMSTTSRCTAPSDPRASTRAPAKSSTPTFSSSTPSWPTSARAIAA